MIFVVRVELTVKHGLTDPDALSDALIKSFGPSDPSALDNSALFSSNGSKWRSIVCYCKETPQSRIICYPSQVGELQTVVEPITGRFDQIFQAAWEGIAAALKAYKPRLSAANQIDESTGQTIQQGRVGLSAEAAQKEIWLPVLLALIAALWVTIGLVLWVKDDRFRFVSGSFSVLAAGVVALGLAAFNAKRRKLRWTGKK